MKIGLSRYIETCGMYSILWILLLASFNVSSQNVGINATGSQPNASAGLDVDFADKGLLIPRVTLTGTSSASPLAAHVAGMMVYNTATTGDVTPGFYYNNGSTWIRVGAASSDFTGNMNNQKITNLATPTENQDATNKTYVDTKVSTSIANEKSSFRVHKNNTPQSINNAIAVKITWNLEEFDTHNDFDLANNRFKPTVAGKYLLNCNLCMSGSVDGRYLMAIIYKNGSYYSVGCTYSSTASATLRSNCTVIVDADGINDYFEAYVYHNYGAATNLRGETYDTYFTGTRIE